MSTEGLPWTEKEDDLLRRLRRCNLSVRLIARRVGRSQFAVRSRLARLGIAVSQGGKHWTAEDDQRLLELRAAGWSASQIGRDLKRSRGSVLGRLHREHGGLTNSVPGPERAAPAKPKAAPKPTEEPAPRQSKARAVPFSPAVDPVPDRAETANVPVPVPVAPPAPAGNKGAIRFLDLPAFGRCRFPLWGKERVPITEKMVCGAAVAGDGPYCEHHQTVTTASERQRQSTDAYVMRGLKKAAAQ